jgi:hypothetical protein
VEMARAEIAKRALGNVTIVQAEARNSIKEQCTAEWGPKRCLMG